MVVDQSVDWFWWSASEHVLEGMALTHLHYGGEHSGVFWKHRHRRKRGSLWERRRDLWVGAEDGKQQVDED